VQELPVCQKRIFTLLDMLKLDARKLIRLMDLVAGFQDIFSQMDMRGPIPAQLLPNIRRSSELIKELAQELELPVSTDAAERLLLPTDGDGLSRAAECLQQNIYAEFKGRTFYGVENKRLQYLDQSTLFGNQVFTNFPSANDDIFEAGMCLSFDRGTACVMHLSRICEAGLRTLAASVGVGPKNDWGKYLNEIDEELKKRYKTAGARSPDEQFYAEAQVTFDAVRRSYRNPSMHVEKSYSLERAEEIFAAVRHFMKHLATKIKE
jgi:hypothetical protein